jgi:hypothetical protein
MPYWHNKGRSETSELQGAHCNYAMKKVGKQTQFVQRVARLL